MEWNLKCNMKTFKIGFIIFIFGLITSLNAGWNAAKDQETTDEKAVKVKESQATIKKFIRIIR